ncbi:MAG TPA: DUF2723 domain-containing protein [Anaerolineae bacterium]|nr:DUF2723 domain-containing protein [Anaerolineae bacterium]
MWSTVSSTQPRLVSSPLTRYLDWPWELIPLLLGAAWLYWHTLPPGLSSWIVEGWDSAMFQVTGSTWGVPHSPGYPLYTILANLFVRLLGWIPGLAETAPAWRVSFWSTCTSLLTVALVYLIVRRIGRNRIAALIASAILALSFVFWRGAIMAEVYSLNAFIFALTYWLALVWDGDRRDRWLILLGLVVGAGIVHHRTAFILPVTVAGWVTLRRERWIGPVPDQARWRRIVRRWLILVAGVLLSLLLYLYLPLAAHQRAGQSWIYADASDWNTFWFIVLTREWWGLVQWPATPLDWWQEMVALFRQQSAQITALGVSGGLVGLLLMKRYLLLFGLPFVTLTLFGLTYNVADLDSMLIPLTLTLCLSLGALGGTVIRVVVSRVVKALRSRDRELRGDKWLSTTIRTVVSLGVATGVFFFYYPLATANYKTVDLSQDWQAVDLAEEVVAMAEAGTPLTIIGQDNSVLPHLVYAKSVLGQPLEPLSTTQLSRMPAEDSRALLADRWARASRVFIDKESLDLNFIPWLRTEIEQGQIFLAPTGHPVLWELLPRPFSAGLPATEPLQTDFIERTAEGGLQLMAYQERVIHKRTGCFLRLTLFWQAMSDLGEDYFVSIQPLGGDTVLDKNDHLALMRGYLPTSQLVSGEVIRDEVDLLIRQPFDLPTIELLITLYQVRDNQFPSFGRAILPVSVEPWECSQD